MFKLGPNGNSGFSNLRSADLPAGGTNPTITGQQDLVTPNLVYGFGQTPGAFTGVFFPNDPTSETSWSAPLLIARGTYNMAAGTLQFNSSSATLLANVFDNGTGNERVAAQVALRVIPFGFVEYNDYNKDGKWDAADYVLWRKTMGQFGFDLPADGNDNGLVDSEDYDIWHTSFGEDTSPGGASSTSTPEPSPIILFALAMLVIAPQKGSRNRC